MKLTIVSGRSGSGKTTALRALEDAGYQCIDNCPIHLLRALLDATGAGTTGPDYAVCIDARGRDLERFPDILMELRGRGFDCRTIYLDALSGTLVKRFSETRRRHPLTDAGTDLLEAIDAESRVLAPIADVADLTVDTTSMRGAELVSLIRERVAGGGSSGLSLLFRSFGFKFGVPVDADLVFDLRCLPNPYWEPALRPLTGLDEPVRAFLDASPEVNGMVEDIGRYLDRWLPQFEANNRLYMTVALGCTGGQHRSVYVAARLQARFQGRFDQVLIRHRELPADLAA